MWSCGLFELELHRQKMHTKKLRIVLFFGKKEKKCKNTFPFVINIPELVLTSLRVLFPDK